MSRKDDHVKLALAHYEKANNDFDKVRFIHHNFSDLSVDDIEIKTHIDTIQLEVPFFINAMSGGSKWTHQINKKLAMVARKSGLAMASGSMSMAFKDEETLPSFLVIKEEYPKGVRFANLQASASLEQAQKAIAWLDAQALQLHVNVAQEIIMPEGDRDFKGWLANIEYINKHIDVPLIVKEVGFGFSKEALNKLRDIGIKNVDISGKGGTNFALIENARGSHRMDYMNSWGQSSVCSLLEAQDSSLNIIASGGIRNMLDVAKALALGAQAVGISAMILDLVENQGVEAAVNTIQDYKSQLKRIMVLLNVASLTEFNKTSLIFDPMLVAYAQQRQLDLSRYHKR